MEESYMKSRYHNPEKYHNNFNHQLVNKIASPCEERTFISF